MAKTKSIGSSMVARLRSAGRSFGSFGYHQAVLIRAPFKGHGPILAFVLIALVGGWALHASQTNTSQKLYQNNYHSCIRGNKVRENQSNIVNDLRTSNKVLAQFLSDAAVARAKTFEATKMPSDHTASVQYRQLAARIAYDTSKLQEYPTVNCSTAVKKP